MIFGMSAHSLQPDASVSESAGPVPLIVAAIAAIFLCWSFIERARAIPHELAAQVHALLADAELATVDVAIDGRDLTLRGEVPEGIDPTVVADRLSRLSGVRTVQSELVVIDPVKNQAIAREDFIEKLRQVDTTLVRFEAGRSALHPDSTDALQSLATLMQEYPAFRIRVAGHTDGTGRAEVNLRISKERASAIAEQLSARGIDRDRIIATGYGATQPIADNATEAGRASNRRIEVSYVN